MKKTLVNSFGTVTIALVFGAIQSQGQSVIYNFSDGRNPTSDGWANAGFGPTPHASVFSITGTHFLYLPLGGFQVGNVASDSAGNLSNFDAAMAAAAANPAGYDISYHYLINTAAFSGATFLQIGTFVNTGSSYYAQDFGTVKEVELNGTQLASGQLFGGTVTINMAAVGFNMPSSDTYFRLGFIENGNGTGVGIYLTDISVSPVPEPTSLALIGLGMAGLMVIRRRTS